MTTRLKRALHFSAIALLSLMAVLYARCLLENLPTRSRFSRARLNVVTSKTLREARLSSGDGYSTVNHLIPPSFHDSLVEHLGRLTPTDEGLRPAIAATLTLDLIANDRVTLRIAPHHSGRVFVTIAGTDYSQAYLDNGLYAWLSQFHLASQQQ